MTKGMSLRLVLACLLAACTCHRALGQTTGRIAGIVKDLSGGVVAKADVRAVNEATDETWSTTTNQAGDYSFLLLPPGLYRIEVAAAGFKTAVLADVPVKITETTIADLELVVGARVETVVVKDSPPMVETDGPQLGSIVDSQAAANLPLASRNFTQILTL